MSIPPIYERMFDASVRVEAAWPFPVSEPPEEIAKAFEMNDDRMPPEIAALYERWPEEDRDSLFSGDGYDFSEAFNQLCGDAFAKGVSGWLGVAATPVFTPTSNNSASFSWGHYRTKLLFAETADALLERAAEWAETEYKRTMEAA